MANYSYLYSSDTAGPPDHDDPKKLTEYAVVGDQLTELTAADYFMGIRTPKPPLLSGPVAVA